MVKTRATETQFNELHQLITTEFLARIKSGEATTADLKAASDWLAKNFIDHMEEAYKNWTPRERYKMYKA